MTAITEAQVEAAARAYVRAIREKCSVFLSGDPKTFEDNLWRREIPLIRAALVAARIAANAEALDLIVTLSEALTDEGGDWSVDGLHELRCRIANVLPEDRCPDWLLEYRRLPEMLPKVTP